MEITELLLKYGQRKNSIDGIECKPLKEFSFKTVKQTIPNLLKEGNFKAIAKKLLKKEVKEDNNLINFVLWVKDELKGIEEMEKALSTTPEIELVQAGIDKLNQFGIVGTLQSLSDNILDWKKIMKLPYIDVYYKLLINKVTSDIQKNYHKIMMEKSKQKK